MISSLIRMRLAAWLRGVADRLYREPEPEPVAPLGAYSTPEMTTSVAAGFSPVIFASWGHCGRCGISWSGSHACPAILPSTGANSTIGRTPEWRERLG